MTNPKKANSQEQEGDYVNVLIKNVATASKKKWML